MALGPPARPSIAAHSARTKPRARCRRCAHLRPGAGAAPTLSAIGETLFWTATSRDNRYVLSIKTPGAAPVESVIAGTTYKPDPHPGVTARYRVRARARRRWSNAASIAYPRSAPEGQADATETSRRAFSAQVRVRLQQGAVEAYEREAQESVEREARERAEREAEKRAEHEAIERAVREARERAEREAREHAEREAKEHAEREARERAEREAKEREEREARERAEHENGEPGEHEAKEREEREARERAEHEAKEREEREARERAEHEAKEREEREAREREEAEHGEGGEGKAVVFTPRVIPFSAPEIPNTGRGLYDWQGGTSGLPPGWPLTDYYMRDAIVWNRDLETSRGVYPFLTKPGVIDEGLAKAAAKGGRLRFRVMAWMPGGLNRMPPYIETQTVEGQTFPNWNSASWLQAWEGLWRALGAKYGSNPRIGWVDTGGYGAWGEAHMDGLLSPAAHITTENFVRMVGDVVRAFPKAHVLIGSSAAVKNESPIQPALLQAVVSAYPSVGFHFDNLGAVAPADGNNLPYLAPGGAAEDLSAWERWKTAPVISEWWNLPNATVALARAGVDEWHVSGVGSGNVRSSVFAGRGAEYQEVLKHAGFRDQLDKLEVSPLQAGRRAAITSTWENVNVAPTYDPWQVRYELRSGEAVVWSGASAFNLRRLLPTEGTPVKASDSFTLPPTLPAGSYTLAVQVVDPTGTVAPMRLADQGRTADGAYAIGTVKVG
ncbi:MAG TPA: DUF4832 domain-containing protein [Solirubrobacteraceae bacterium]|nr:DUF4832 domain-containing protein [Solirubrobacteraceae bacterium]